VETAEGRLRHAAFVGMRPDKDAREVRREWCPGANQADVDLRQELVSAALIGRPSQDF
jgi:ATP-dependent DNA ligase